MSDFASQLFKDMADSLRIGQEISRQAEAEFIAAVNSKSLPPEKVDLPAQQ